MRRSQIIPLALMAFAASCLYGQTAPKQTVIQFMGRTVRLTGGKLDGDGFPEGPAQVCFDSAPKPQCYVSPGFHGLSPKLTPTNLGLTRSALLFSAVAWAGGSGASTHFALLHLNEDGRMDNLFPDDISLSGISAHAFWTEASLSDAPIFVTADYVWGPSESHFDYHRFIVSAYVLKLREPAFSDSFTYSLDDRYMTVRKYPSLDDEKNKVDILGSEKPEIIARLKRVKAEAERERKQAR